MTNAELFAALEQKIRSRPATRDPLAYARIVSGFSPDPWQHRLLIWSGRRLLLNCHRQAGKSTTTSVVALHRATMTPGVLILLISPSLRQSTELLRKVAGFLVRDPSAGRPIKASATELELANGSRIVSLPSSEQTIRGFSAVDLIIEDEAGDVDDELHRAVRPMLAIKDAPMILMGTPKGRRGHFFDAWENGGETWERIEVRVGDCPRIAASFLEEERRALGPQYAQEYEASFITAAEGLVYGGYDRLRNWIADLPAADPLRPWRHYLGCDFGIVDPNAFTVLAYRDRDPCAYIAKSYRFKGEVDEAAGEVRALDQQFRFEKVVGDLGGMGKAFESRITRHGIYVHAAKKADKLGHVKLLNADLRAGKIKVVGPACVDLLDEIQGLRWVHTESGNPKEDPGASNHAVDSFLYSWVDCTAYANRAPDPPATTAETRRQELDAFFAKDEARLKTARDREWWDDGAGSLEVVNDE